MPRANNGVSKRWRTPLKIKIN